MIRRLIHCRAARLAAALFFVLALATLPAGAQSLLQRQGEVTTATTVNRIASAALDTGRLVTAVRNGAGNLEVTTWDLVPDGTVTKLGTVTSTAIKEVAVAALSTGRFVTAARQGDDSLLLTSWGIDTSGNPVKLKTFAAGPIVDVAVASLGSSRLVTVTTGTTNLPKVIQWSVDRSGTFTRGTEFTDSTVTALSVSVTALTATQIATAYVQSNQTLLVTTWDVAVGGAVTKKDTVSGVQVTDAQIVTAASDRVVTGSRRLNGNVQVAAWDVDAAGNVTAANAVDGGAVVSLALSPLGTTRVATAVRQTDDTLKITAWQVVDQVHQVGSITGGTFFLPSIVNLGYDRLVTPLELTGLNLKVIAWREASVGLLHATTGPFGSMITAGLTAKGRTEEGKIEVVKPREGEFGEHEREDAEELEEAREAVRELRPAPRPAAGTKGALPGVEKGVDAFDLTDEDSPSTSPASSLVFQPNIEGVDPMIAVGKQFMLVSQQGRIGFFDKAGNPLPTKWGGPTNVMTGELFRPLWQPVINGVVNRNNINLHLRFPLSTNTAFHCDATAATPTNPCVNEMYDTRIAYDRVNDRFVIVAAVRHQIWMGDTAPDGTLLDPIVRRYFAIGVSRTDDPRDGFQTYITTEPNYSDWPRVGLGNGILIVAHNAGKAATDLKPMAYVFSISDMSLGSAEPRNWKIDPFQTNGGTLFPVYNMGPSSGWNYMVHPNGNTWDIFSFQSTATTFSVVPTLRKTTVNLGENLGGYREGIIFRNNRLYITGATVRADRVVNLSPAQLSVRLVRIPILFDANGFPMASNQTSDGFMDFDFGYRAAGDTPNHQFSYEVPSVAVNANNDVFVSFGRVPVNNLTPQEARYFIFRNATSTFQGSRLLQAGSALLTTTYTDATGFTAVPFARIGDDNDRAWLDYANAVTDPSDDTTFWMCHAFSNGNGFKMVVGKVVP